MITPKDIQIEVRSAAYLQTWKQSKLSDIRFNIKPAKYLHNNQGKRFVNASQMRPSDVYVFCLLTTQKHDIIDPLDLAQWDFYILKTIILNRQVPGQKTIGLSKLLDLKPTMVQYTDLSKTLLNLNNKI